MNEYQRMVYKRTAGKIPDLLFIETDESFKILYMSSAFSKLGFNVDMINDTMPSFPDLLGHDSAEKLTASVSWNELSENKIRMLDVEIGAGETKDSFLCLIYKGTVSENKIFDIALVDRNAEDFPDKCTSFSEMHYDCMYKNAFDKLRIPVAVTENGQVGYVNGAFSDALGCKKSVLQSMRMSKMIDRSKKEDYEKLEENLKENKPCMPIDVMFPTQQSTLFRASLNSAPVSYGESNTAIHIALDNSEQERDRYLLKLFEGTLNFTSECIMIVSLNKRFVWVNAAFERELGYLRADISGLSDIFGKNDKDEFDRIMNEKVMPELESSGCWVDVQNVVRADGTAFPGEISLIYLKTGMIAVRIENMSKQLEVEKLMESCKTKDMLTGVANIETFKNTLHREFEQCKKDGTHLCVIMFQIRDFNTIFRRYGFETANAVLKMLAQRAKNYIGGGDRIARLGECRFGIVYNPESDEKLIEFLEGFMIAMDWPMVYGSQDFFINVSVGAGTYPGNAINDIEMYSFAYDALRQARTNKRSSYAVFTREQGVKIVTHKNSLETELVAAMSNDEFKVLYQPKALVSSNEIVAGEALARWVSPSYGTVPPNSFITTAENTGMIVPLGYKIMEIVCRDLRSWTDSGLRAVPVSINLTMGQLTDPNFTDKVKEITEEYKISPSLIEFEVSESNAPHEYTFMFEAMKKLRENGIMVSIDNFGTGTTSLSQLSEVPVMRLTIDRSLVNGLEKDRHSYDKIAEAINHAKETNRKTIAEGVENMQQLEKLRELGCDCYQGYFLSKPVTNEDFAAFLK